MPLSSEQLNQLINLLASITLLEMMVAIGLGVSIGDLLHVATDWRLVSKAVLASYACVPAAAVGLLIMFRADPFVAAGFLICAVCPGAPYSPPFTGIAKGNVGVSVGLMVILAGSSALAAPLLLQILLPVVLQFLPDLPPDSDDAALVRVIRRDRDRAVRVPAELVAEMSRVTSLAQEAWAKARKRPLLESRRPISAARRCCRAPGAT